MSTETKATHTPGPWFQLTGGILSNSVGPHWSANEHLIGTWRDKPSKANMRLITMAPDLLVACRETLETLLTLCDSPDFEGDAPEFNQGGIGYEACETLRTAIAKATE